MKNNTLLFNGFLLFILVAFFGCDKNKNIENEEVKNHIEQEIPIGQIAIGNQVWMIKNLAVTQFHNGDVILEAKTAADWKKANKDKKPAWCYYDNLNGNGDKFGKLYNWYAVNDSRGLAPKGWHIPSDAEWTVLCNYLGGSELAGKKLKSYEGWHSEGKGNNESGFAGLPGGSRSPNGVFLFIGSNGIWWSSEKKDAETAWTRNLYHSTGYLFRGDGAHGEGLSVRCLKD